MYESFPGLHGALDAALEGAHGEVFVDDPEAARVARIVIGDFHCVAGDPAAPAAADALRAVPLREYLAVPEAWHDVVRRTCDAHPYERFAYRVPERWDRAHLAALQESLPAGYRMLRIDAGTYRAFCDLNETFVSNFASKEDYLARGVGFGIVQAGRAGFVAGCSSYTISSRRLEFEIETHGDVQRRGLALITGARMIEHCLDNELEPCWDAAHEGSALLAERLGFVGRRPYTAFRIGAPPYRPES
jgi:hypothetical protein